jgi:protein-S-isoprenylcysteine O-methyltransferase Ste14
MNVTALHESSRLIPVDRIAAQATPAAVHAPALGRRRSVADWLGFTTFMLFAGWLLSGPRSLAMFLVVPVLYEVGIATTFLLRGRARRSTPDLVPRVIAYGSTFLIPVFVRLALRYQPALVASSPKPALQAVGMTLWLFGLVLGFWPLWHLRSSFSIEPAARELVTAGPYQIARHPIYASYLLNFSGLLLQHLTVPMAIVTSCWFLLTCTRMRFEEQVLTAAFPEYRSYQRRVGALGPRFWRRQGRPNGPTEAARR